MNCRFGRAVALGLLGTLMASGLARAGEDDPGRRLFRDKGCIGCHSIGGQGGKVGPALDHVGDRYSAEWMYTWLRNPAAVKPGTVMPKLPLTDEDRALLVFFLLRLRSDGPAAAPSLARSDGAPVNAPDLDRSSPDNEYLRLGVEDSYLRKERQTLQDQIQSFIPPLYEPAFTQSAFVLPPGAIRVSSGFRNVGTITDDDVAGQQELGADVIQFDLKRRFYDFDLFLGLDHNVTLRLNVPVLTSDVKTKIHPGFFAPVTTFPAGSSVEVGDISLFLKKKLLDQGNFPVGLAAVGAIRLPTGSDDEKFLDRTTVTSPMGTGLLGDGIFRRFTDDGELPASLQPGLGTVGGSFGLFLTRQLEGSLPVGRGAFHTGALYEIRPGHDGVDPGDLLKYFATFVKPVLGDFLSLDLTYLLKYQQDDSYEGRVGVPTAMGMVMVDRPSFTGGTSQFIGTSLILSPNPLFRLTLTGLTRVAEPRLGPSPPWVVRLGLTYTFSSSFFRSGDL